ncbi:MAG: hypothetical protein AB7U20_21630, partial [Planctomycetaceae bacterium]
MQKGILIARIYRPTIVRYVDPATGKRCMKDTPGAKRVRVKSKTWRGEYRDADGILRSEALCANKQAAQTKLAERIRAVQSGDPFHQHRRRPLTEHVADFIGTLRDAGRVESHVTLVESRCRAIISECWFRFIGDISASRVQSHLADLKQDGMAQQTVNHYLRAIKQFTHWLVRDRRTGDDRLQHLQGGNVKAAGVKRELRELTDTEIARLMHAARTGPVRRKLTGEERALLYASALGTGFRALELSSLTPAAFELYAVPATVTIEAADEKRRRGAVQPLPPDLVALLRPWLAPKPSDAPLWPGRWAEDKQAGQVLKSDLQAARDAGIDETDY